MDRFMEQKVYDAVKGENNVNKDRDNQNVTQQKLCDNANEPCEMVKTKHNKEMLVLRSFQVSQPKQPVDVLSPSQEGLLRSSFELCDACSGAIV